MGVIASAIASNKLYILLGIGVLFNVFWLSNFKEKFNMNTVAVILLSVLHTIVGVLSVKVFAFLEGAGAGAMSLFGGIFFMPLTYYIGARLTRRNVADVFDTFTVCMVFTVMCARINCIFSGCCLGIEIPGTDGILWPTRQMEVIFYIVLLIVFNRRISGKPNRHIRGTLYPMYMMSYGIFRFIIEWLRESDNLIGVFHISHIWAVIATAIGSYIFFKLSLSDKSYADKSGKTVANIKKSSGKTHGDKLQNGKSKIVNQKEGKKTKRRR